MCQGSSSCLLTLALTYVPEQLELSPYASVDICARDLSSVTTLSIEEPQALEDLVTETKREAVQEHANLVQTACKEHSAATAQEAM